MENVADYIKQKIKDLMNAQHLTMYSLAKAADLTQTCIANWYSSRNYEPSLSALEKVCEVLGVTLSELFCSDEEEMIPVDQYTKKLFNDWQKLNFMQKDAIKTHIESYLE